MANYEVFSNASAFSEVLIETSARRQQRGHMITSFERWDAHRLTMNSLMLTITATPVGSVSCHRHHRHADRHESRCCYGGQEAAFGILAPPPSDAC